MTDRIQLACPKCGEPDGLVTVESIEGHADLYGVYREPDGRINPEHAGWTEIIWDSSETVGFACGCGWEGQGKDLVPYESEDEDDRVDSREDSAAA